MADRQHYRASDDSWATMAETVVNDPVPGAQFNLQLHVEPPVPIDFAVFAIGTPTGTWAPFGDAKLEILDANLQPLALSSQSPTQYLSPDARVAILVKPAGRTWNASVREGSVPFAVAAGAYHATAHPRSAPSSPVPRRRCRVCKTTAKALALAIVAAAGAAAMPAALLAAVGTFLGGVGAAAAAAFIGSVVGDTADVVAEKLCMTVSLCP